MAAPPGFDPNASVLPDPGASSAPIHVMRGGGMKGGGRNTLLSAYKLGPGQELANVFSEEEKEKFVEALNTGGCNWTTKSVLNAKCAPVVNVLKALLKQKIKTVNAAAIPETIKVESKPKGSWMNTLTKGLKFAPAAEPVKEAPAVLEVNVNKNENENENNSEGVDMADPLSNRASRVAALRGPARSLTGLNAMAARARAKKAARTEPLLVEANALNTNAGPLAGLSANLFENEPENELVTNLGLEVRTNVVNSPKNFQGNRSRRRANLKLNLTKKNNRKLYSNFNINSNPIRIYGNTPSNIAKRYNFETKRTQKLKKGLQKTEGALTLAKQDFNYQTSKVARAETERAISEKKKANFEAQRRKVAENAARTAEQRRLEKERKEKLEASQKRAANLKAQLAAAEKEREEQEIASGLRKPKPSLFTRAKSMLPFGKKGGRRTRRRNTRRGNRK